VLTKRWISVEDFQLMARSHQEFLNTTGLTTAEGALLPEEFLRDIVEKYTKQPDWLGFLAIRDGQIVGSGAFKDPPFECWTEIGYGVAPEAEGQGVATQITTWLCEYAASKGATIVRANTLPVAPASQKVLNKNGFTFVGVFEDPEDGTVHRYEKQLSQKH
jgi:RimJ/RimL family protein N-acetyltransferase